MSNDLICPICGEPTRVYMGNARKDRLCAKHADMLKAGELVLGDDGVYTKKHTAEPKAELKFEADAATSDLTCIACGGPSNGKHFCLKCYKKYRERTITIEV